MISNWALVNIFLAFASGIIAIVSLCKQRDADLREDLRKRVRLIKSLAIEVGVVACLVCLFSKHEIPQFILVDQWTIVLFLLFVGEIMAAYFIDRRSHNAKTELIGGKKWIQ